MKSCGKAQRINICKVILVKHKTPCDFKECGKAFEDNIGAHAVDTGPLFEGQKLFDMCYC